MKNLICLICLTFVFYKKLYSQEDKTISVSTMSKIDDFVPQSNRNPFLSPMDYENIKKAEIEKKKKEELLREIAEKQKKGEINKDDEDIKIFKTIKLQGIVGKYAIINGDMVEEGKYYKKKFLVEKIGPNYVIISYKGKKSKLILK